MGKNKELSGNLLGASRAEVDQRMLESAFVETHDFRALTSTLDFNFIVGRRGTGKSVLFLKVPQYIRENKIGHVCSKVANEYENFEFQNLIRDLPNDYRVLRAINRIAWRVSLLITALKHFSSHYKAPKSSCYKFFLDYTDKNKVLMSHNCTKRVVEIITISAKEASSPEEIPGLIATNFQVEKLNDSIAEFLNEINRKFFIFFDGLDEGWIPEINCTSILGGLAACASDLSDKQSGVHVVLFVRDNIFRALSFFDKDFSRHIEGNSLRLKWDDSSLLSLVSSRLRASLGLGEIENDIKIWNRFARKDLQGRDGFVSCLNYTLYRPRDLLVLLNNAFVTAARSGRNEIIKEDIESSSLQISLERLNDLLKEYDKVFPGLRKMIDSFKGGNAFWEYVKAVRFLDKVIDGCDFNEEEESDFAVLGSGEDAFFALYSIGFLGIENSLNKKLQFCHDGSSANINAAHLEQRTCIHPCYWKALNLHSEFLEDDVMIELYDNFKPDKNHEIKDLRTKRIGQLVAELPNMAEGHENAADFEKWVFRTIKILFAGQLSNPQLKPNQDNIQRRDIVATNMNNSGFWKRVYEDFKARQVVIEVKNYSSLKPPDYRQAVCYTGSGYGKFVAIVNRDSSEGVSQKERGWIKEMYDNHGVLVFTIPAPLLARCVGKLRSKSRFDYADKTLNKRLDLFFRTYLSLRHEKKSI